jgi:AcrR family transcriptional regulator
VTNAAPYRHFPSYAALLEDVAAEILRELAGECGRAAEAAGHDRLMALTEIAVAYVRFFADHAAEAQLVFSRPKASRPPESPAIAAAHDAFTGLVERVVTAQREHAIPGGDPVQQATTMWALMHGLAVLVAAGQLEVGSAEDLRPMVERHLATLFAGLAANPPPHGGALESGPAAPGELLTGEGPW